MCKRGVLLVTFFVLDWSRPLRCRSAGLMLVIGRLDFVFFWWRQHLICTDQNVSATMITDLICKYKLSFLLEAFMIFNICANNSIKPCKLLQHRACFEHAIIMAIAGNVNKLKRHETPIWFHKTRDLTKVASLSFYFKDKIRNGEAGKCSSQPIKKIRSLTEFTHFHTHFSSGKGVGAAALEGVELPRDFRQPLLVLLGPHQDGTEPDRICNHATWSSIDHRVERIPYFIS